jgi:hypothetical protein
MSYSFNKDLSITNKISWLENLKIACAILSVYLHLKSNRLSWDLILFFTKAFLNLRKFLGLKVYWGLIFRYLYPMFCKYWYWRMLLHSLNSTHTSAHWPNTTHLKLPESDVHVLNTLIRNWNSKNIDPWSTWESDTLPPGLSMPLCTLPYNAIMFT